MKKLILLLLLGSFSSLYAQKLSEIKFDSIVKIENTNLSLIYNKKKTAVWDNKFNYMVLEFTKNKFVYLKSVGFMVEVDAKKKDFYALVTDNSTLGYRHFFIANTKIGGDVFVSYEEKYKGEYILLDTFILNSSLEEIDSISNNTSHEKIGEFKLEIIGQNLFITDYKNKYFTEDTVYSISNSGIYNFKDKKWLLSQKWHHLFRHNAYVLASEIDRNDSDLSAVNSKYKLFEICGKEKQLVKENISVNNIAVISLLTSYDSIVQLPSRTHYLTYKNGNKGLIKFQLFENNDDNIYKANKLNFEHELILEMEYDFIYYGCNKGNIITKKGDSVSIFSAYYKDTLTTTFNDTNTVLLMSKPTYLYAETAYHDIGIKKVNDSLIVILDSEFEESVFEEFILESVLYPGEDSLDAYGDFVYKKVPPLPGMYNSGVFNTNSNQWIIKPNKYTIDYCGGHSFLVTTPLLDNYGNILNDTNNFVLDLVDFNGDLIKPITSMADIRNDKDLLNTFLCLPNQWITYTNTDLYSNLNIPQDLKSKIVPYLITDKNKYKAVEFNFDSKKVINESDFHDFVRVENNDLQYKLIIDSNKVKLSFGEDENINFSSTNYKIEISNGFESAFSLINMTYCTIVSDTDTIFKSKNYNLKPKTTNSSVLITKKNNEILIQRVAPLEYSTTNFELDYDYYIMNKYEWEKENSEIWRKQNKIWQKATPSYASIHKFNNFFVCKTGAFKNEELDNYDPVNEDYVNPSYIILDSATLKPISYSDYYNFDKIEDLGFGLKVTPNYNEFNNYGNSFLINKKGKAMCDAIFDDFRIIDNKLYGIKEEVYQLDYYGDIDYDEEGELIIIQAYSKTFISNYPY